MASFCGFGGPQRMITDLRDLEPLLGQYDPGLILVGPVLSLSISGYRYFNIAANGSKVDLVEREMFGLLRRSAIGAIGILRVTDDDWRLDYVVNAVLAVFIRDRMHVIVTIAIVTIAAITSSGCACIRLCCSECEKFIGFLIWPMRMDRLCHLVMAAKGLHFLEMAFQYLDNVRTLTFCIDFVIGKTDADGFVDLAAVRSDIEVTVAAN